MAKHDENVERRMVAWFFSVLADFVFRLDLGLYVWWYKIVTNARKLYFWSFGFCFDLESSKKVTFFIRRLQMFASL